LVQKGDQAKPVYEAMFPRASFEFLEGGLEQLLSEDA